MVYYTVKPGDYLVKIAQEHGTTWQAIWSHPENAAHRARRSGPDELYPGDVLAIDVSAPGPVPVAPPPPNPPLAPPPVGPPVEPPGPTPLEPWPYPAPPAGPPEPSWECPEGICVCHRHAAVDEQEEHVIVLYDALGLRMPLARTRVREAGRLLDAQQANAQGELTVKLRATTRTVELEWAPASMPSRPELPYSKRYRVRLGDQRTYALTSRLANLGFSSGRSLSAQVRAYQRAYHEPQTGRLEEVASEVSERHDRGRLPPFTPAPSAAPDSSGMALSPREDRTFATEPAITEELSARSDQRFARLGFAPEQDPSQAEGGDAGGSLGSAVPAIGHLEVLARDRDPARRHRAADVSVAIRSVETGQEIRPSPPPEDLHGFVWASFYFLPSGRWEILGTAPKREGRKVVEVTTGASTWTTVELVAEHTQVIVSHAEGIHGRTAEELAKALGAHVVRRGTVVVGSSSHPHGGSLVQHARPLYEATGEKISEIHTLGHAQTGFETSVFELAPGYASALRPYLSEDATIVFHGCSLPKANQRRQLVEALPPGAQVYGHEHPAGPGQPFDWVKLGPEGEIIRLGEQPILGTVLPESYVRWWSEYMARNDPEQLAEWLSSSQVLIPSDVRPIMQDALDRARGRRA